MSRLSEILSNKRRLTAQDQNSLKEWLKSATAEELDEFYDYYQDIKKQIDELEMTAKQSKLMLEELQTKLDSVRMPFVEAAPSTALKTESGRTIRIFPGPKFVTVKEGADIPDKYLYIKVFKSPNKTKIKTDLEAGKKLDFAYMDGPNLFIKLA